jgi:hypothetical protein
MMPMLRTLSRGIVLAITLTDSSPPADGERYGLEASAGNRRRDALSRSDEEASEFDYVRGPTNARKDAVAGVKVRAAQPLPNRP